MENNFWTYESVKEYAEQFYIDALSYSQGKGERPMTPEQFKASKSRREVILTTDDGKALFENDDYWIVWKNHDWEISDCRVTKETTSGPEPKFSTRQAAEAYVTENKPCLSLKEVREALTNYEVPVPSQIINDLTTVVKSKLNQ